MITYLLLYYNDKKKRKEKRLILKIHSMDDFEIDTDKQEDIRYHWNHGGRNFRKAFTDGIRLKAQMHLNERLDCGGLKYSAYGQIYGDEPFLITNAAIRNTLIGFCLKPKDKKKEKSNVIDFMRFKKKR